MSALLVVRVAPLLTLILLAPVSVSPLLTVIVPLLTLIAPALAMPPTPPDSTLAVLPLMTPVAELLKPPAPDTISDEAFEPFPVR